MTRAGIMKNRHGGPSGNTGFIIVIVVIGIIVISIISTLSFYPDSKCNYNNMKCYNSLNLKYS